MKLYLIRHGETEANTLRVLQGHWDTPLTSRGIRQADALARRLASIPIRHCYTSDLGRAQRTAEIILQQHRSSVRFMSELRERSFGEFEGRPVADFEQTAAETAQSVELFRPAGGENEADLKERLGRFLREKLVPHAGEAILFVAHAATNRAILQLLGVSGSIRQDNACLNILEFESNLQLSKVEILNCTAHLSAIESPILSQVDVIPPLQSEASATRR